MLPGQKPPDGARRGAHPLGRGQRARADPHAADGRHARGDDPAEPFPEEKEDGAHRRAAGGAHRRALWPRLRRALFAGGPLHRQGRPGGTAQISGHAALAAAPAVLLQPAARGAHAEPAQRAPQGNCKASVPAAHAGHVGRAARARGRGDRAKPTPGHRLS